MNLSILIPTVPPRENKLYSLLLKLVEQIESKKLNEKIEILILEDNFEQTIGSKRNKLLNWAKGKYIVFIDDDDDIHIDYCGIISEVIDYKEVDYIGYKMARIFGGSPQLDEHHSIKFDRCYADEFGSYRHVSHKNPILTKIAKRFVFPDINSGEDVIWCNLLFNSGLLKTEYYIRDSMYIHNFNSKESLARTARNTNDKRAFDKIDYVKTKGKLDKSFISYF